MVDVSPPKYEEPQVIQPTTHVVHISTSTEEEDTTPQKVGMTETEKHTNHFVIVYGLVMSVLYFVYGLDIRHTSFKYDVFGAMMATGVIDAITVVIGFWRMAYNVSSTDARSFVYINALAGLGVWMYMIIILDSSDGALLKANHAQAYALMLASVIISGILIVISCLLVCLCCCTLCFGT